MTADESKIHADRAAVSAERAAGSATVAGHYADQTDKRARDVDTQAWRLVWGVFAVMVSIGILLFRVQGDIAAGRKEIETLQEGMQEVQDTLRTHVQNAQTEAAAQQDDPNEIAAVRSPTVPLDSDAKKEWLVFRAGGPTDRTTWDGVYTTEQADRGAAVYDNRCSRCHQPDSGGTEEARPLTGDVFMRAWRDDTVGNLYARGLNQMSFDERATLSDADYVDSIAYLLQSNGFPAGSRDLTAAGAASVRIEEVPSFAAIMQVVGCLTRADDGAWELSRATRAVLADDPFASSAEARAALAGRPLGTETFELMVYPDPAVHDGHVMEVKGSLIRSPGRDRIAVSSLGMVASTCDP